MVAATAAADGAMAEEETDEGKERLCKSIAEEESDQGGEEQEETQRGELMPHGQRSFEFIV